MISAYSTRIPRYVNHTPKHDPYYNESMKDTTKVVSKTGKIEPAPTKSYPAREKKDFALKHPPQIKPKGKRAK